MNHETPSTISNQDTSNGSMRTYVTGFILAMILTNAAFLLVISESLSGWKLATTLSVLAIAQLWVQLRFFLHLGSEDKSRWNVLMFLFAGIVVVILVFGSLWIMNNLHYNMTPSEALDKQLIEDEGIKQ